MQHPISKDREEDVDNEATTKDLLHRRTKGVDVGSMAERLILGLDCIIDLAANIASDTDEWTDGTSRQP
ncbi:MAG: hypothetical protein KZQ90_03190 [Candidatus Thiodiazotropha sp. (ex Codakia rugifera)]|nr:hypothetical protein [Candidatus Thiodiazotropha sp. (ex Codakia rugifera)]